MKGGTLPEFPSGPDPANHRPPDCSGPSPDPAAANPPPPSSCSPWTADDDPDPRVGPRLTQPAKGRHDCQPGHRAAPASDRTLRLGREVGPDRIRQPSVDEGRKARRKS